MLHIVFLIVVLFGIFVECKTIPKHYPLFKQCDARWGGHIMEGHTTICKVGCLMSSISMALHGHHINITTNVEANPGTLNQFLRTHNGYNSGSDLFEKVVDKINPHRINYEGAKIPASALSIHDVEKRIDAKHSIVIANVMHGRHFVLVTGYDGDTIRNGGKGRLYVNDPGFTKDYYLVEDVVGWRLYNMH